MKTTKISMNVKGGGLSRSSPLAKRRVFVSDLFKKRWRIKNEKINDDAVIVGLRYDF